MKPHHRRTLDFVAVNQIVSASMSVEGGPSLLRRVASGAAFMVLLRLAFRGIGLVSTLILVRLLAPTEFGLAGVAMAVYSLLDMLSELSFRVALIRMKDPQRVHYDTAWTLGVIRGGLMALILLIAAPFISDFMHDARAEALVFALAALAVLQGFENMRITELYRNMQFDRLFWYQLAGKVAGFMAAIPAAFFMRSYWALFLGVAASRFTLVVLSYVLRPYRPAFSLAGWPELFDFSKWLMITNGLWAIDTNIVTLVIGRVSGPTMVGVFQVANQIAVLPASDIAAPVREPIFAGYARVFENPVLLRKHFLDGLALITAIVAPMAFGISVTAEPITTIFLGWQWTAAIPLIQLCALYGLFDAIGHFTHNLYLVLARQKTFVTLLFVTILVRVPAIIAGGYFYGATGAAAMLACTAAFNMVLWNLWIGPAVGVTVLDFVSATWRTFAACAAMMAVTSWFLSEWTPPPELPLAVLRFVTACLWGACAHVVIQLALWYVAGRPEGAETHLLRMARSGIRYVLSLPNPRPSVSA